MQLIFALPACTFILLLILERMLPTLKSELPHSPWDLALNGAGLLMQGCVVPAVGYWTCTTLMPRYFAPCAGIMQLSWPGSFLLNMVVVDFLYYWQHRAFHSFAALWKWHYCHHACTKVDIWATARNSIMTNFLFIYCTVNPPLAFLCGSSEGFYVGAMVTASLDVFRHSRLRLDKIVPKKALWTLSHIFVLPCQHHNHHRCGTGKQHKSVNMGANFILWDLLFGTAEIGVEYPESYGDGAPSHPLKQLLYPLFK